MLYPQTLRRYLVIGRIDSPRRDTGRRTHASRMNTYGTAARNQPWGRCAPIEVTAPRHISGRRVCPSLPFKRDHRIALGNMKIVATVTGPRP
jgi:hypothetical protein